MSITVPTTLTSMCYIENGAEPQKCSEFKYVSTKKIVHKAINFKKVLNNG